MGSLLRRDENERHGFQRPAVWECIGFKVVSGDLETGGRAERATDGKLVTVLVHNSIKNGSKRQPTREGSDSQGRRINIA
jgi:hypothetical protein